MLFCIIEFHQNKRTPSSMPRKAQTPSLADQHTAPGGAAAVDRALCLLQSFRAGDPPLTLAQLAERSGLYKSTVLRLLASLEHAMLTERLADGRYVLGAGVQRLQHVYASTYSTERVVMPVLRELVAATRESAAFHVQWGAGAAAQRVSLFRVESDQPIRDHYKVGDVLPMTSGVGARILVAFGTDQALADAQADQALLARVRKAGYYSAIGDRDPEVAGIGAPVYKRQGHAANTGKQLAGALLLTMPEHRYNEAHVALVQSAAQRLSAALGVE
jgi:DNA-binding IclR family transcriptional regulator